MKLKCIDASGDIRGLNEGQIYEGWPEYGDGTPVEVGAEPAYAVHVSECFLNAPVQEGRDYCRYRRTRFEELS
jgi:hypothetical protein